MTLSDIFWLLLSLPVLWLVGVYLYFSGRITLMYLEKAIKDPFGESHEVNWARGNYRSMSNLSAFFAQLFFPWGIIIAGIVFWLVG